MNYPLHYHNEKLKVKVAHISIHWTSLMTSDVMVHAPSPDTLTVVYSQS